MNPGLVLERSVCLNDATIRNLYLITRELQIVTGHDILLPAGIDAMLVLYLTTEFCAQIADLRAAQYNKYAFPAETNPTEFTAVKSTRTLIPAVGATFLLARSADATAGNVAPLHAPSSRSHGDMHSACKLKELVDATGYSFHRILINSLQRRFLRLHRCSSQGSRNSRFPTSMPCHV